MKDWRSYFLMYFSLFICEESIFFTLFFSCFGCLFGVSVVSYTPFWISSRNTFLRFVSLVFGLSFNYILCYFYSSLFLTGKVEEGSVYISILLEEVLFGVKMKSPTGPCLSFARLSIFDCCETTTSSLVQTEQT